MESRVVWRRESGEPNSKREEDKKGRRVERQKERKNENPKRNREGRQKEGKKARRKEWESGERMRERKWEQRERKYRREGGREWRISVEKSTEEKKKGKKGRQKTEERQ